MDLTQVLILKSSPKCIHRVLVDVVVAGHRLVVDVVLRVAVLFFVLLAAAGAPIRRAAAAAGVKFN